MLKCTIHMRVCCMCLHIHMRVGKGSASLILHTFFSSQTLETLLFLAVITYLSYINIHMHLQVNIQKNMHTYIHKLSYLFINRYVDLNQQGHHIAAKSARPKKHNYTSQPNYSTCIYPLLYNFYCDIPASGYPTK